MSRGIRILVIAAAAAFAVTGWVLFRDTTTPVAASIVQNQFSGELGSSPGDPGIYSYHTDGFEEIDALSGARHEYPGETFMTITEGECGPVVRWDALSERWVDWEHCGPGLAVTASDSHHEWFGIPDLEEEVCAEPRPVIGAVGDVTTTVCVAGELLETYETTIVGIEVLEVGGVAIETTHLRRTSSLSGGSTGTADVGVWRVRGTPLVARMEVSRHSVTSSPVGDVAYVEEFVLELVELTPGY